MVVPGAMPSSIRSTSSSWPNSVPVSLNDGQLSSCTPQIITVCHSWPLVAWAVTMLTASGTTSRRSRTPVGNSCSSMWVINASIVELGRRSTQSPAASKSAMTASKSRSAWEPAAPPRMLTADKCLSRLVADQISHNTSSTLPPCRPAAITWRMRPKISCSRSVRTCSTSATKPGSGSGSSTNSDRTSRDRRVGV